MTPALAPGTLRTIHRVWARRLGAPAHSFEADGVVPVVWDGADAVSVVRLGGAIVLGGPESALGALRDLPGPRLLDPAAVMLALEGRGPRLFGAAHLAFVDQGKVTAPASVRSASRGDLEEVLATLSEDERAESGLREMERWWVASGPTGAPAAAAGCETWDGAIAHLGVAVAPQRRGTGLGAAAASAAIARSLASGLVPQWRSGVGNAASRRLGTTLGAVPLGEQVTVDLDLR
ncbi:GNAT family N-acetyltransferase [Brachybacterium sp. YJGR34]|uniref:GNAT family N-acetyltransferase n=1 Tax=Brachybacterium sp. YJGR34 TaxID=2059911 RepID=UPI000E0BE07A|nr:GNAT family N-acetyltransferase [Brachybacterium sp. YJGR34]